MELKKEFNNDGKKVLSLEFPTVSVDRTNAFTTFFFFFRSLQIFLKDVTGESLRSVAVCSYIYFFPWVGRTGNKYRLKVFFHLKGKSYNTFLPFLYFCEKLRNQEQVCLSSLKIPDLFTFYLSMYTCNLKTKCPDILFFQNEGSDKITLF